MSAPKTVRVLSAGPVWETDENGRMSSTPGVGVGVELSYLASRPVVTSILTADQALALATQLIAQARRELDKEANR
jgi:hypothetical protein